MIGFAEIRLKEHPDRIRKSLRYSILDGAFAASMIGFGESFLPAFAVFLKATSLELGLLTSLPQTLGSLSQLLSTALIRVFRSRKRLVCWAASLQGAMYLPVALVFFLDRFRVGSLILFACLYWIFGMILGPAWNSWMGDLTEEVDRGAYFGKRSAITGAASFLSFLAAGALLQRFSGGTLPEYAGFGTIFALALAARVFSVIFLTRKFEPVRETSWTADFGFLQFLRQARFRNYGLLALYLAVMNFAVYLSVPFFTPYMLEELGFDYLTYTLVQAAAMIAKILAVPLWGRAADRFGSRRVLTLSGFLMPVIPALWVLSADLRYLVAIQIYSGFVWAAFEISSFHFIFDTTSPEKRATCVAYYNVLNGLAIFAGSVAGGVLVRKVPGLGSPYFPVFLTSCLLRYAASWLFVPRLREVRAVEPITYSRLFLKVISALPTKGLIYHLVTFRRKRTEQDR